MSNFTIVEKRKDIIIELKKDFIENDYFPNVYMTIEDDQYVIGTGNPDINDEIRLYFIKRNNNKEFDTILERETRNITEHRIKTYEYLISNYNNSSNTLLDFQDVELNFND